MMYKDKIKQLCQEQTNLDEADIEHLVQQADELLKNSAYANEDVFIDVKISFQNMPLLSFTKTGKQAQLVRKLGRRCYGLPGK